MSVEPQAVRFQFGAPCMPPKPEPKGPVTFTLEQLEQDAAMIRKRFSGQSYANTRPQNPPAPKPPKAPKQPAADGRKVAYAKHNRNIRQRILDLMTGPISCAEICKTIALHKSAIAGHLGQMRIEGLVTSTPGKGRVAALWVRVALE